MKMEFRKIGDGKPFPFRWRLRFAYAHIMDGLSIFFMGGTKSRDLSTAIEWARYRRDDFVKQQQAEEEEV